MAVDAERPRPMLTYELVWKNGKVETVQAHYVGSTDPDLRTGEGLAHIKFYVSYELVLSVCEADILSVRLLSRG